MTWEFLKGVRAGIWQIFFLSGLIFTPAAFTGYFAMSPDVYGHEIIAIPAEIWSAIMLGCSTAYLVGLFINGRHWITPYLRLGSSLLMVFYFAKFIASAAQAPTGDLVMIFSVAFVLSIVIAMAIDAREVARKWRLSRDCA